MRLSACVFLHCPLAPSGVFTQHSSPTWRKPVSLNNNHCISLSSHHHCLQLCHSRSLTDTRHPPATLAASICPLPNPSSIIFIGFCAPLGLLLCANQQSNSQTWPCRNKEPRTRQVTLASRGHWLSGERGRAQKRADSPQPPAQPFWMSEPINNSDLPSLSAMAFLRKSFLCHLWKMFWHASEREAHTCQLYSKKQTNNPSEMMD